MKNPQDWKGQMRQVIAESLLLRDRSHEVLLAAKEATENLCRSNLAMRSRITEMRIELEDRAARLGASPKRGTSA